MLLLAILLGVLTFKKAMKYISSEQTVLEISAKRDVNWNSIDKAPLGKAQTDLKNTQSAMIFAINQMAQTFANSTTAR